MLGDGYNFGGEQSGHFIFLDHNTTGDGLISALQVLSLMKRTEQPLSELAKAMTAVPQVLLNVKVSKKPHLDSIPELQQANAVSTAAAGSSSAIPAPNPCCVL
jgi:phosphoglucosamine mutase